MPDPELSSVAEQLRRKLAAAESRVQHLRAALREIDALLTGDEHTPPGRVRTAVRSADNQRAPGTGAALLTVLRRGGSDRAWTAHELASELAEQGLAPASADPANAVRTALGRLLQDDRIERVGHGQYRVKSELEVEGENVESTVPGSEQHDEGVSRTLADAIGGPGDEGAVTR
jgi:hypothetical protein